MNATRSPDRAICSSSGTRTETMPNASPPRSSREIANEIDSCSPVRLGSPGGTTGTNVEKPRLTVGRRKHVELESERSDLPSVLGQSRFQLGDAGLGRLELGLLIGGLGGDEQFPSLTSMNLSAITEVL